MNNNLTWEMMVTIAFTPAIIFIAAIWFIDYAYKKGWLG